MLVSNKKSALFLKTYLKQQGVQHIVICPGSRNLPLIISFSNDSYFSVYSIIDERIAGFIALGIIKATGMPAAVVTTSGSAVLNLAPAMVEAYYQRLPLIAITADRPHDWVEKGENQTIRQKGIFSNYCSLEIEVEESIEFGEFEKKMGILNRYFSQNSSYANLHINLPFSEPLGSTENLLGEFQFDLTNKAMSRSRLEPKILDIKVGQNVIIYISTQNVNFELNTILNIRVQEKNWVVISEFHSGWYHSDMISHIDLILSDDNRAQNPDILITIGETMLSKKFRKYIQTVPHIKHYDISTYPRQWNLLSNTYQNIVYQGNELKNLLCFENSKSFFQSWHNRELQAIDFQLNYFLHLKYNEFNIVHYIMNTIEADSYIFWGNSSAVRYGNWSNWKEMSHLRHLTNRGVAGIEGVLATAIGYQKIARSHDFYCIIGDVSLEYEHSSLHLLNELDDFKLIVINNKGGQIFRQIHDIQLIGNNQPLMTPTNLPIVGLCQSHNIQYFMCFELNSFLTNWQAFKTSKGKVLFEIKIDETEVGNWKDYFAPSIS